jgi:hypothetical protein
MRHPTSRTIAMVAGTTLALAASGCGISDPLNDPTLAPRHRLPARSPNEIGIPRAARPSARAVAAAAPSPTAAIAQFGRLYINWTADTLAARQRQLAAISIGEASSTERRAAAHTPSDYELRRSHVANHGSIIAIAPTRPARPGAYMVITRERTTGAGLYNHFAAAYHLTIATVQHIHGGWAVSQWQPQN